MGRYAKTINTLLKALETKGIILLVTRRQYWDSENGRRGTMLMVSEVIPVEEYNKEHPKKKKDPKKQSTVTEVVFTAGREIDVVQMLAKQWQEVNTS